MPQAPKGMTLAATTFKATLLAAALTAGSAFAHQTNPQCYVDGVQIRPVVKFAFTSRQIAEFHVELQRRPPGPGGSCPAHGGGSAKSCGQVDDHWDVATLMAGEYCAKVQGASRAAAARPTPVAEVNAPSTYRLPNHHEVYTYKNADPNAIMLQGMCVICETPTVAPSRAQRSGR